MHAGCSGTESGSETDGGTASLYVCVRWGGGV